MAKKYLGQHFLVNKNACERIVDSLNITLDDNILEIGPGRGALTKILVKKAKNIVVVEKDYDCVSYLNEQFKANENIKIIHDDFMKFDLLQLGGHCKWKVVSNLPYNVANPILFRLMKNIKLFDLFVLMFQYEVAKRIVSLPSKKSYGFLSVIAQFYTKPKLLFTLRPGSFYPPPNIDSSVIKFIPEKNKVLKITEDEELFIKWVDKLFQQRRKMLMSRLDTKKNNDEKNAIFSKLNISIKARPEELSVKQWAELFTHLYL